MFKAEHIFQKTGDVTLAQKPISFEAIIGSGLERSTLDYGTSKTVQVYLNPAGKAKTAYPIWGQ
ncbi:hypothetical protein [Lysobacter capsici]|uniref:hypothetical protein n=1 Tax=Lysobacter capsici TaxID=435897 RepID=UPI00398CE1DE